jgi:hypothetical protein
MAGSASALVTDRMDACQSMIRRKREIHWVFDKLSERVRVLRAFFFAFEFANPVKGPGPSKHARVFLFAPWDP